MSEILVLRYLLVLTTWLAVCAVVVGVVHSERTTQAPALSTALTDLVAICTKSEP